MSIEGVHAQTQIFWTNTEDGTTQSMGYHHMPRKWQRPWKTGSTVHSAARSPTAHHQQKRISKQGICSFLGMNIIVTLLLQTPGACAQTCFQQQLEAHSIKEKISCASQIKARMLLFKFPFNLLMPDKSKKQDSSQRYATVPKMSTEQQRFKTGTKTKTVSICRLSMSCTNTEPASEKENACGKESLSALSGFTPHLPPCQASNLRGAGCTLKFLQECGCDHRSWDSKVSAAQLFQIPHFQLSFATEQ